MGNFRVETLLDDKSGKIYAVLYYPETDSSPFAQTDPIYSSHEQAEQDVLRLFKEVFNK